ncbi:MAG: Gfo/Idh/MocA family oxidoreductase [bacterium]|nr:Gfo/Idh/MocA family oxidoreductase [bacterium]
MLKVGVVGLRRGRGLFRVFHNHKDTQVTAVCDLNGEAARTVASEFGIPGVFTEFDAMLDSGPDVVVVATPAPLHAQQAIRAMEAGIHVLSEVPAAWTLAECGAIAEAVRKTGCVYMMAENMNFYHYVQDWKQRVQGGEIGKVFYAEAEYIHDCRGLMRDTQGKRTWRADMPPIYYCTHSLGPVLDILDDRCVSAVGMHTGSNTLPELGVIDMEVGLFRTEKGAVIKILCGFTVTREPAMHWQIFYGTEGSLENRRVPWEEAKVYHAGEEKLAAMEADASHLDAPPEATAGGHGTSEYYMVDGFIRAVIEGTEPPIDVYRSLDFSTPGLCAHLSAQQGGKPVEVPNFRV